MTVAKTRAWRMGKCGLLCYNWGVFPLKMNRKYLSFAAFKIWLRYFFVAAAVFVLLFVIGNWPALRAIFDYYALDPQQNPLLIQETPLNAAYPLPLNASANEKEERSVRLEISVSAADDRLVIPSLALSVPIKDISFDPLFEKDEKLLNDVIQTTLREGVVRYPGTAEPGKRGNTFITGHSSYYLWDPGAYKDVFAVLPKIKADAEIKVFYRQKEYRYRVKELKEVWPSQVDVLNQTNDYRLTLMTCTPVGTNLRRFIVVAELIAS